MITLKPCPFCGGTAMADINFNRTTDAWFAFIKCKFCNARGKSIYITTIKSREDFKVLEEKYEDAASEAAEVWNRRV